jgi:RNA polymerase sigma-70 factor, ECF subfamily
MRDQELVSHILCGDRRALHHFYLTYKPALQRRIKSKISNAEDADEVLQDTLYAFLEAVRDFRGNSSVKTFLMSIGNNKITDYYRRKRLRHAVFSQMPHLEELVSPILTPEDALDVKILREKIRKTMEAILPQYKHILISKYAEDRSVAEIAKKLETTMKSAESVLFRARRAFVKAFISM